MNDNKFILKSKQKSIHVVPIKQTDIDRQRNINYTQTLTIINDNQNISSYLQQQENRIMIELKNLLYYLDIHHNIILDKNNQYRHIRIPKKKGGYREIVDPSPILKEIQRRIKNFLENTLLLYPHNAAHAYIKQRDILTNANIHKSSKMFLTLDIHNFFGSITKETLLKELRKLNNIMYFENKLPFLEQIIEPCLLDGVLPQGSPTSPILSNLIMIEFDETVSRYLDINNLKYTRYADDIFISGDTIEKPKAIQIAIQNKLNNISTDLILNKEKTKILRPGKCYITGIKINKDNNLTFGHEQKNCLKHKIYNLFVQDINGECVKEEVQEVLGLFSYAHRIEPAYFNYIEKKYLKQFNSKEYTLVNHFKKYL